MSDLQALTLANVVLPLVIVAGAFLGMKLHERALRKDRERDHHPAE